MYSLILPLGILNFLLVLIQILGGLKIIKISYKAHKYFGIALGCSALLHGALAIFIV
jgi:hypothetical protein